MDDAQRSPLRFFLVFSLTYLFVAKVKPTVWISVCFFMQRSSILQAQVGLWKRKCSTLETQWGQCDNLSFGVFIHHVLKLHFLSKVGLFSCFLLLFVPFKSQVCSSPESYWWNVIRHQSGTVIQWYRWVSLMNAFFLPFVLSTAGTKCLTMCRTASAIFHRECCMHRIVSLSKPPPYFSLLLVLVQTDLSHLSKECCSRAGLTFGFKQNSLADFGKILSLRWKWFCDHLPVLFLLWKSRWVCTLSPYSS